MEQIKAEEFDDSESKLSFDEMNEIQINDEINTIDFDNSDVRNELRLVRDDAVESEQQICTSFRELKDGLEEKLASGIYILMDRYKSDARQRIQSPGWNKFYCVVDAVSKRPVGFGKCKKCGAFIRCLSSTTGLLRHDTDKCKSPKEAQNANSFKQCDRDKVKEAQVLMCAQDGHPVSTVAGHGLSLLGQILINIGAKYGQINIQDVIFGPTEISKAVSDVADDLRLKIIPEVKNAVTEKRCAFTTEMWPDGYKNLHYVAFMAHYVDSLWKLQNVLLCCSPFPEVPKSGEYVHSGILEQLGELDISLEHLKSLKFVTDSNGYMLKVLEGSQHLDCMAHVISSILSHTFDEHFLRRDLPAIQQSIDATKIVVTYFMRRGLVCRLRSTLTLQCSNQWSSCIDMLESLHSQIEDITKILEEENASQKLDGYNASIVEFLIKFLGIFKEAAKSMEADNEPTLQLVILWFYQLQKHCTPEDDDVKEIIILKNRALSFLKEKYKINLLHKIATFLVPKYRSLKKLSDEERAEVRSTVKKMCLESECASITRCEDVSPPPQKHGRFDDWSDDESHVTNEVDHYLYTKLVHPKSNNILEWWKTQSLNYPQLSNVAKQVLCIPATNSSCERCFRSARHIFSERRCNLDVFCQSDLLFVCQNKTE